jgi:hypothetical protein
LVSSQIICSIDQITLTYVFCVADNIEIRRGAIMGDLGTTISAEENRRLTILANSQSWDNSEWIPADDLGQALARLAKPAAKVDKSLEASQMPSLPRAESIED